MNHSQHMSSSCTSFSCYLMRFHNWECNSKEGKRPRSYLIERSFTVGPGHSLELGLGPFDWAANRNARKRGPRLDWRDERKKKKVHAQASCLWSGKVAGTVQDCASAVVMRPARCAVTPKTCNVLWTGRDWWWVQYTTAPSVPITLVNCGL